MTSEREGVRGLLERAVPFLREAGEPYEDDGSNEPLELARSIEDFLASRPSDEGALSSASLAFDGGREASPCPHTRKEACDCATPPADAEQRARELLAAGCGECGGRRGYMTPGDDGCGNWTPCGTCRENDRLQTVNRYQALRAIVAALTQQPEGVQAGEAVIGVVWDDGPYNSNPGAVLVKRGSEDEYIAKWGGQRLFLASALAQQPEPKPGARGVVDGWALTKLRAHEARCDACGRAVWDGKDRENRAGFLTPCGKYVRLEDCGTADCAAALTEARNVR